MNQLFYGDNLELLRGFPDGFVDPVYLDPPFDSNAGYHLLCKSAAKHMPARIGYRAGKTLADSRL